MDYKFKIILLGNIDVGKTSLITRCVDDTFGGQEEEFDDVIEFGESENSSSNDIFTECFALFRTCDEILDKYYTEGNYKKSLVIRRNLPLKTQCRDGRQFNSCNKKIFSDPNCESIFKSMSISGQQEANEKLFKFICVDEFNAFSDQLSCILSDAVLDIYNSCFNQHFKYRNCSDGTELYKCFQPAINQSPECTVNGKLLFREAANKLTAIHPLCETDKNREDEKEDSDEIVKQDKDSGEIFEKEVDKNGVQIKLQLEVNFPKDKKEKKTRNIFPWF